MSDVYTRLQGVFGETPLPNALFYAYPYGLRIELGGSVYKTDSSPVPRFLRALDRARVVVKHVLGESQSIGAVISYIGSRDIKPAKRGNDVKRQTNDLMRLGLSADNVGDLQIVKDRSSAFIENFGEDAFRFVQYVNINLNCSDVDTLIWASVSSDMCIEPRARFPKVYFVDFSGKKLVHIYDDRGMDIVGLDYDAIKPFYTKFNGWLLDYDRKVMDEKFGH